MNWTGLGLERSLRGLRTGDQRLLLTGAALLIVGWMRRNGGQRKLVFKRELKPGKGIVIRAVDQTRPAVSIRDQIL